MKTFMLSILLLIIFSFGANDLFAFQIKKSAQDSYELRYYNFIVKGRVVDEQGLPVAKAHIIIDPKGPFFRGCTIEVTQTDDDGRFEIHERTVLTREDWVIYISTEEPQEIFAPVSMPLSTNHDDALLSGLSFKAKKDQVIDLGDVRLQLCYRLAKFNLPIQDETSLSTITDDFNGWAYLRTKRGAIIYSGTLNSNVYKAENNSLLMALPQGEWQLEIFITGQNGSYITGQPLVISNSDQVQEFTLIKKTAANADNKRKNLTKEQARQQLLELGFEINNEALIRAIYKGNSQIVKLLLIAGIDPNIKDADGDIPIILASKFQYVEIVKDLIKFGADVTVRDIEDNTALLYAATQTSLPIIKILIENGSDVNARGYQGITPLMYAVKSNSDEFTEPLLNAGADINAKDELGITALMHTITFNREEQVKLLIKRGADVNFKDQGGVTALMYAAERGGTEIIKELITNGAKINAWDNNGYTALSYAIVNERSDCEELLRKYGATNTPSLKLFQAIRDDNIETLKKLIKMAKDINVKGPRGLTPLMYAIDQSNEEAAKLLITNGANINVKSYISQTPLLSKACTSYKNDIVAMMIDRGISINESDKNGFTPLMYAAENGNFGAVKLLLEHGANRELRNRFGKTALDLAVVAGQDQIAELLQTQTKFIGENNDNSH